MDSDDDLTKQFFSRIGIDDLGVIIPAPNDMFLNSFEEIEINESVQLTENNDLVSKAKVDIVESMQQKTKEMLDILQEFGEIPKSSLENHPSFNSRIAIDIINTLEHLGIVKKTKHDGETYVVMDENLRSIIPIDIPQVCRDLLI